MVLTDHVGSRVLAEYTSELEAIVALELISPAPSMGFLQQPGLLPAAGTADALDKAGQPLAPNGALISPTQLNGALLMSSPLWAAGTEGQGLESLAGLLLTHEGLAQHATAMQRAVQQGALTEGCGHPLVLEGSVQGGVFPPPLSRPLGKPPRADLQLKGTPVRGLVSSASDMDGSTPVGSGRKRGRNSGGGSNGSDHDDQGIKVRGRQVAGGVSCLQGCLWTSQTMLAPAAALYLEQVSKYRGVVWDAQAQRWRAQLSDGGYLTVIGHYTAQEEAARAYDAAIIHSGRKERINFPPSAHRGG